MCVILQGCSKLPCKALVFYDFERDGGQHVCRVGTNTYKSYKKNLPRRCLFLDFLTASCAPAVQAEAWPLILARHHPGMLSPRSLCYPVQACEWSLNLARIAPTRACGSTVVVPRSASRDEPIHGLVHLQARGRRRLLEWISKYLPCCYTSQPAVCLENARKCAL